MFVKSLGPIRCWRSGLDYVFLHTEKEKPRSGYDAISNIDVAGQELWEVKGRCDPYSAFRSEHAISLGTHQYSGLANEPLLKSVAHKRKWC